MKEKMEEMAKIRQMEMKMNVSFEEREFLWDPDACGGADDFLAMVEGFGGEGGLDEGLGGEGKGGEGTNGGGLWEKRGCRRCEEEDGGDERVCRICSKLNTAEGEGFRMLPW